MTSSDLKLPLDLVSIKRWTIRDYHQMAELGILDPRERTELITGQIILMAPKGTAHVTALQLFADLLRDHIGGSALVRTQDPIQLDPFSEPEPDLVIVKGTVLDYAREHPGPAQIQLVIEISDSTLQQDCQIKDKLYAQAGIIDYWVLDVRDRQLHLFREPTAMGYAHHVIFSEPDQVSPLAFPDLTLSLTSILPPLVT